MKKSRFIVAAFLALSLSIWGLAVSQNRKDVRAVRITFFTTDADKAADTTFDISVFYMRADVSSMILLAERRGLGAETYQVNSSHAVELELPPGFPFVPGDRLETRIGGKVVGRDGWSFECQIELLLGNGGSITFIRQRPIFRAGDSGVYFLIANPIPGTLLTPSPTPTPSPTSHPMSELPLPSPEPPKIKNPNLIPTPAPLPRPRPITKEQAFQKFAPGGRKAPPSARDSRPPSGGEAPSPTVTPHPTVHPTQLPTPVSAAQTSLPVPTAYDDAALKEAARKKFRIGQITYRPDVEMEVGKATTYEVRLTQLPPEAVSRDVLTTGLPGAGEARIKPLRVGCIMKVTLTGKNFDIIPITNEVRWLDPEAPYEPWRWSITPRKSGGNQEVYISAQARANELGEIPFYDETYTATIKVKVTPRVVWAWAKRHWEWIAGSVGIPLVGWLWQLYSRRKEGTNKTNKRNILRKRK
jgi:hypothetical protein